ncbi:type II secretion system F family protein [Hydrogenophaga sp. T2]|uniref:type II secretion system F family protein n=1 Tax=Hydrogenophaga sp. T2 TaxID=3132823 RepID=UPI003CEE9160
MEHRVIGVDETGQLRSITIDVDSSELARERIARQGMSVLRCDPVTQRRFRLLDGLSSPRHRVDVIAFALDLSTLLDAGVTVKESLQALRSRERAQSTRSLIDQLIQHITQGHSLSDSLKRSSGFPDLLIATVAASEQTGDLALGLRRYAKHQEGLRAVRDRVVGASVYPLLLLIVGTIVVVLLLSVVVPRFAALIDINGRDLPLLSRLMMDWGRFVAQNTGKTYAMFAVLTAAAIWLISKLKTASNRRKWLASLPVINQIAREFQHLQMYRTAAILTSRGVPIHTALPYCKELLEPRDQDRLAHALQLIREGTGLSDALTRAGLSDAVASSMLGVAERSGSLSEMLDRTADFYERSLQRKIDIASRLIEPIMMIIFGVLVGGIVIMMYLPIFDLASSIE